jgi:hypothetical protein
LNGDAVGLHDLEYLSLAGTVLPVLLAERSPEPPFCGSGVLLGKGIFVTCWHCVEWVHPGARLVVGIPATDGSCTEVDLQHVERDAGGADLALGVVDAEPTVSLELAREAHMLMGQDVWSFGYPYTDQHPSADGGYDVILCGRILRGYATRTFSYDNPDGHDVDAYELDMPVPSGLSGAPLILRGGLEIAGVVFGTHDVETVDVETHLGERVQTTRVVAFGLAHTARTLRNARALATKGLPLADYLKK